ncbi:MAG: AAA family ATPase, partial [Planctomycetaceae bacterium]
MRRSAPLRRLSSRRNGRIGYHALMSESERPVVVVVAGPNGAGKSTAAPPLVRDLFGVTQFVNPDVIAQGLSAFDPNRA